MKNRFLCAVVFLATFSLIGQEPPKTSVPPDSFSGTTWPHDGKGDRLEFHMDKTFLEVWKNYSYLGRWQKSGAKDKEVMVTYAAHGQVRSHMKHFRISADGKMIQRTEG